MQVSGGSVTMRGVIVADNMGMHAAGCELATGVTVSIEAGTVVRGNIAGGHGGGIRLSNSVMTADGLVMEGNVAATQGGGIYVTASQLRLNATAVRGNMAGGTGGGISVQSGSEVVCVECEVEQNQVGSAVCQCAVRCVDRNTDGVHGGCRQAAMVGALK